MFVKPPTLVVPLPPLMGAASVGQMQEVVPAIKKRWFLWNRPLFAKTLSSFKRFVKNQILSWCTWKTTWFLMLLKATSCLETTRFASSHSLHGAAIHWGALVHDSRSTAKILLYQQIVDFHKNNQNHPKRLIFNEPPHLQWILWVFCLGVFHTFHLFSMVFIIFPPGFASAPPGLDRPPPRQRQRAGATETSGPSGCVGLGPQHQTVGEAGEAWETNWSPYGKNLPPNDSWDVFV